MRRIGSIIALALLLALVPLGARASTADTAKRCVTTNGIRDCLTLTGVGGDLAAVRVSITNLTDADFCGQAYVSKNDNTDWKSIPECVSLGNKVVVTWDVSGHEPFPDGTVFCDQFVTDQGVLGGQPCVVLPILPPRYDVAQVANTSQCDPQNSLKQCLYIAGFVVHVDYVKGTQYGISGGSICGYEHRYENGADVAKGRLCVPKGTGSSGYVRWNVNRNYQNGTVICTRFRTDHGTWSGKPCGTIG